MPLQLTTDTATRDMTDVERNELRKLARLGPLAAILFFYGVGGPVAAYLQGWGIEWLGGLVGLDLAPWGRVVASVVGGGMFWLGAIYMAQVQLQERRLALADLAAGIVEVRPFSAAAIGWQDAETAEGASNWWFDDGDGTLLLLSGDWLRQERYYTDDGPFPCDRFCVTRAPASGHVFHIALLADDTLEHVQLEHAPSLGFFRVGMSAVVPGELGDLRAAAEIIRGGARTRPPDRAPKTATPDDAVLH